MNKYQDIQVRHNVTRSFPILPSIKIGFSSQCSSPIKNENYQLSVLSTPSTKGFLEFSKNTLEFPLQILESTPKTKSNISNYTPKPQTISEYSAKQNEIVNYFLTPRDSGPKKITFLPDISVKSSLPTEREFSKLIENLNEVVSPRVYKLHTTLQENDPVDVTISESKVKYFKIPMKNKRVPLAIKIKRTKGKLYMYSSVEVQEPGPNNYEKCFISDYIEIRDSTTVFKYDLLYLGIKAFEDSQFKITISFGRQINSLEELKRLKRQSAQARLLDSLELEEDEEFFKETTKTEAKTKKNFIAENKHASVDHIDKNSILSIRAADWKTRRDQIVKKKKLLIEMKKSKTLDLINKKALKKQMKKLKSKEQQIKAQKNYFSAKWLNLIHIIKCSQAIHEKIQEQRDMRLRRISVNLRAMQIQGFLKKRSKNVRPKDTILIRASNLLKFYRENAKNIKRRFGYGKELIISISQISHAQVVFRKFSHFYRSIIRIQRNTRKFLSIKEKRMKELVKMWGIACETMLFKKSSKRADRKRQSLDIISLPVQIRDDVLNKYYRKCALRYRQTLRHYFTSLQTLSENRLFQTAVTHMCNNLPPFFKYLPSVKEMEKMIEASIVTRA